MSLLVDYDRKSLVAVVRFGQFEMRPQTRELLVAGRPLRVPKSVFHLILYLVRQRPRTVTHGELLRELWPNRPSTQSQLARTVMIARRMFLKGGGSADLIESEHGIGYRFTGAVNEIFLPGALEVSTRTDSLETGEILGLLHKGWNAVSEGHLDEAAAFSDEAQARAIASGSQGGQCRTLSLQSALAMRRGNSATAAMLATKALQIAKNEAVSDLIAEARIAAGRVHLCEGDRGFAIEHLRAAQAALDVAGSDFARLRCERLLARALRDNDDITAALQLCRRSIESTEGKSDLQSEAAVDKVNEVMYLIEQGDQRCAQNQSSNAQQSYLQALKCSEYILTELRGTGPHSLLKTCLANHAAALERLGHLEAAWEASSECDRLQHSRVTEGSPLAHDFSQARCHDRARLLHRSGRLDEALEEIQAGLDYAEQAGQSSWLPELYGLGARIAEQLGQVNQAMIWTRRQAESVQAIHQAKADSLAAILAAELKIDDIKADLEKERQHVHTLLRESEGLRRRVQQLESKANSTTLSSFDPPGNLPVRLGPLHVRARCRQLPMCIAILAIEDRRPPTRAQQPNLNEFWMKVGELLEQFGDLELPAIRLTPSHVLFHIRDSGLEHARTVCEEVLRKLSMLSIHQPELQSMMTWKCTLGNAATEGSLAGFVDKLLSQETSATVLTVATTSISNPF